jgi:serine/threonine kinase 32
MKAVPNIIQERRLLEEVPPPTLPSSFCHPLIHPSQIDHPFVVNLRYAFQDDENCFFVLDLMLGGDLRCMFFPFSVLSHAPQLPSLVHLERLGSMEENVVRFYVAQLSAGLSFIHEMGIMHRFVSILILPASPHLIIVPGTSNQTTSYLTRGAMPT